MQEQRSVASDRDPNARSDTPGRLLVRSFGPEAEGRFVSIGTKLGLAVVFVVGTITLLAFVWFTAREHDALVDAKRQAADMVADLFAASLGAPLDFGDEDGVRAELKNLLQNPDVTLARVWQKGQAKPLAELTKSGAPEVKSPLKSGTRVYPDRVEVAREIRGVEGKAVGSAVVAFSLARENDAYMAVRGRMLGLCLIVAFGTMGVLLIVTRREVVAPIDRLLAAVRRLERGESDVVVGLKHRDELGRLGRAFEAMGHAIVDREAKLADANKNLREVFDHMRQAILVFDTERRVVGARSRQAGVLFAREELRGTSVDDLLYPGAGRWDAELRAFEDWCALAFDAPPNQWPEVSKLAPPSVRIGVDDEERVLALEFRPIASGGRVLRVMLLATDITEKNRLEREVAEQGERHRRQMAAMQRLVSGGGGQFVVFLENARRRLGRAIELTAGRSDLSPSEFTECFGQVHTLRGEARIFGLDELSTQTESLESSLSDLRALGTAEGKSRFSLAGKDVIGQLRNAQALVDEAERLFVEASPIGRAVLEQVTVRRPDLLRLCEFAAKQGGEIASVAERLSARSLGDLVAPICDSAPRWAESLNKRARVVVEGRESLVPDRLAKQLSGAITHLVKNAIAHGIELPEERERIGKSSVGVVQIRAVEPVDGALAPTLYVEDDGQGIDDNDALVRAAEHGATLNQETAADSSGSFRTLPPTEAADLSGRGMGLAAAAHDLAEAGFSLSVERRENGGTRFSLAPVSTKASGTRSRMLS
jgi:two-component system, chemotaxis family, sensor kinase CheA